MSKVAILTAVAKELRCVKITINGLSVSFWSLVRTAFSILIKAVTSYWDINSILSSKFFDELYMCHIRFFGVAIITCSNPIFWCSRSPTCVGNQMVYLPCSSIPLFEIGPSEFFVAIKAFAGASIEDILAFLGTKRTSICHGLVVMYSWRDDSEMEMFKVIDKLR